MTHSTVTELEVEEKDMEEEVKTLVWWHINSCPIPCGYNPRLVGPAIESALKKIGLSSDHITITAVGNLKDITGGEDVLRDLSSTGIYLRYAKDLATVHADLLAWASDNRSNNQTVGTIMLISGPKELEYLASTLYNLDRDGHDILLAHSGRTPDSEWLWKSFLSIVYKDWPWESLLKDVKVSGSADNKQEMRSSEKDGTPLFCALCDSPYQSFQGFIDHFKCQAHTYLNLGNLILTLVGAKTGNKRKAEDEVEDPSP